MPADADDGPLVVILVNYGLADRIERLLADGCLSPHRVLLVDNASQPDQIRELARRYDVDSLLLERNYGFAGAVNRALPHTDGDAHVLLLNPDVRLREVDLAALRRALVQRDLTGISPLLLNSDGSIQVGTAGGPPTLGGFLLYFLFASHIFRRAHGVAYTRRQLVSGLEPAWLCMACLLLRGDAFARYGPIPERELVYAEDVAWGAGASAAGARFMVLSEVRVIHEQGAAGESRLWRGALGRLALHEQGPLRGRIAVAAMSVGLAVRRLVQGPRTARAS